MIAIAILVIAALLLIVYVVVVIVRSIVHSNMTRVTLVKERLSLHGNGYVIQAENMPASINGNEYTYGFWMNIASFAVPTNEHKILWYRASSYDSMRGCPLCMLDKDSNKVHFILSTNLTRQDILRRDVLANSMQNLRAIEAMAVVTLDYMPTSNWVHIALVVRDRYVTLYVDGEVYANGTVEGYAKTGAVISPANGTIYVGNEKNVKGELTKMEFCNYAASSDEVAAMYASGPDFRFSTLGGFVNLPMYGLRWPVYRIGSTSN